MALAEVVASIPNNGKKTKLEMKIKIVPAMTWVVASIICI
jgi:hypothetical protein